MKKLNRNEWIGVIVALSVVVVFFLAIPASFSSIRTFLFGGYIDKVELIEVPQQNTSSDLVIEDIVRGVGTMARTGNQVTVHYIGRFKDGIVFDNSIKEGIPFIFTLGDGLVIEGFEVGIVGMKVGGRRMLVIPPELAYGKEGRGPIPPDTTLIFEIELLEILEQ